MATTWTWTYNESKATATYTNEANNTTITISNIYGVGETGKKSVDKYLSIDENTITVKADVLGAKDVSIKSAKTNSKGDTATTYTLALDGGVPVSTTTNITAAWTVSGTKATWTQTKAKYYGLVDGVIKYYKPTTFELANINGLNTSVAAAVTAGTAISNYITVNDKTESTPANIQLSAAALGTGKVTLTNPKSTADLAGATPTKYELSVHSSVLTSADNNKGKAVWTLSKGTATYKVCTAGQYYAFNDPKTIIEYKAPTFDKTTAATFTITGLNTTVTTNGAGTIPGITIDGKTVKVARSLFTTKDIAITGDGYKLEIVNDISATDINAEIKSTEWSLAKTTATFTQTLAKGYTLSADGKSIYYTAKDTDSRVLATVDGVSSELNTAAKLAEALKADNATGVITVSAAALNEAKLTAKKGNYTLALATDDDTAAVTVKSTDPAWSIKGTTVTYSTDDTAGYRESLTNPKEITYSAKPTTTVIASITNVSTGLADKTAEELATYFNVNTAAKAITVDAGALGTATMKQTAKTGYTIAFNEGDETIPQEAKEVEGGWLISKGTATFQKYTAGYYANSNGTIAYTADKKDKASITIKGLNANATAADLTTGLSTEGTAVTINSKDLLGTGAISITGGTIAIGTIDGVYTTKEAADKAAKNAWNINGTKAIYSSTVPEYYVADSKNPTTKINYVKAAPSKDAIITINGVSKGTTPSDITIDSEKVNVTLAANALEGLKVGSSVTITPSNDAPYKLVLGKDVTEATAAKSPTFAYEGKKVKLTQGYTADGYVCDGKSITAVTKTSGLPLVTITGLKDQATLGSGKDINDYISVEDGVITVDKDALNGVNVTMQVASGSYKFALDEETDVPGYARSIAISGKDAAKNTGANISETVSGGYTLGSGDQTILYTKPVTSAKVAATVSGLKIGSTVGEKGDEDKDVEYDKTTGVITVNANALEENVKKKVALAVKIANTGMNYSLALGGDVTKKSATTGENAPAFSYDAKGNVLLKQTPGEGFMISPDGKGIAYYDGKTEITLATISGLDKTIPEKDLSEYLTLGTDDGVPTITLKQGILSSTKIAVKGSYGYVLGLDEDVATEPKDVSAGWVVSKTTKNTADYDYVKDGKSAYYVPAANKTSIDYKPSTGTGTSTITLTGLKAGLSVNADGSIDGITPSGNGKVLTLDNRVLGTSDITVTGDVTLALSTSEEEDKAVPNGSSEQTWAINKNTATLTAATEEGYKLEEGSKKITYTAASASTTLATVSGFNPALTEETIGNYLTASGTKLTVKGGALGRDDLKLTKGTCTTIELADDVTQSGGTGTKAWVVSGTTAEYFNNCYTGYYSVDTSTNKTVKYNAPAKDYNGRTSVSQGVTITGLPKNFKLFNNDFTVNDEKVTVAESVLSTLGNGKTLQISGKTSGNKDYYLAVADEDLVSVPKDPTWAYNNNKLEIKQVQPEGYMLSDNNKTITYIKDNTTATLATITGIKTGLTDEELKNAISIDDNVITISDSLIDSDNHTKIALSTKGNYTLALAARSEYYAKLTESAWSVKGTTATYTQTYGKGYSLSADGKSLTYSAKEENTVNAVALSGILLKAEDLNVENNAPITISDDNVITLNEKALTGTTAVKINGKNSKYTLATTGVTTSGGTAEDAEANWVIEYDKTAKTNTAKLVTAYAPHYAVSNANGVSSITYTPAAAVDADETPLITISGLNPKATITPGTDIVLNGLVVTLSANALSGMTDKSSVTISGKDSSSGKDYTLKLADGLDVSTLTKNWTVTGKENAAKTAVYTNTITKGYTCDGKKITYASKDTTVTLLTLKNLSPNFTVGETDVTSDASLGLKIGGEYAIKLDGNNVVMTDKALGTAKTTLGQGKGFDKKATEYTIKLDEASIAVTSKDSWYVNGTVAKYIACDTNTWTTTADKNGLNTTVNYVASTPTEGATPQIILEGLNGVTALTEVTKISADTDIIRNTSGTITVADKIIANSSKLALTYGDYKFALAKGSEVVEAATLEMKWKEAAGTSTTATLMQTRAKNKWYLSNNEKTITKSTKDADAQIAVIKGLAAKTTTAPTLTEGDTKIYFGTSQLSKKVTIDSGEGINFSLGDYNDKAEGYTEYTGAAITGSANADITDVWGSGHTITGGKGNDQITIHADNTLVYASGDGDDLITGFTKGSTIKINGMAVADFSKTGNDISAKVSGDNIVVTLTKGAAVGTMTLVGAKDVGIADLKIVDKSGNAITPTTATSDLIYSDNYATASELSDMVSGGSDTFSVGNIDTGNATNIAQQDTPIITGSDDK